MRFSQSSESSGSYGGRCDVPEYALDQGVAVWMLHVPEVQWTVVGALEPLEHHLPQVPYSLSSLYFILRGLLCSLCWKVLEPCDTTNMFTR